MLSNHELAERHYAFGCKEALSLIKCYGIHEAVACVAYLVNAPECTEPAASLAGAVDTLIDHAFAIGAA